MRCKQLAYKPSVWWVFVPLPTAFLPYNSQSVTEAYVRLRLNRTCLTAYMITQHNNVVRNYNLPFLLPYLHVERCDR